VKPGSGADEVRALLQDDAVAGLRIVESLQVSAVAVNEGGVGQRPQVVGSLELRRVDPLCQAP
jgi:hypothetical protein